MVTEEATEVLPKEAPFVETLKVSFVKTPKAITQQPLPSQPYADWFQALLDQNLPLTSVESFKDSAYRGHVSHELGVRTAGTPRRTRLPGSTASASRPPTPSTGVTTAVPSSPLYANSYWAQLNG